jgi:hypothetical protein
MLLINLVSSTRTMVFYLVCVAASFYPATIVVCSFLLFIRPCPIIPIALHPTVSHSVLHFFIYLLKTITFYSPLQHWYLSTSNAYAPSDVSFRDEPCSSKALPRHCVLFPSRPLKWSSPQNHPHTKHDTLTGCHDCCSLALRVAFPEHVTVCALCICHIHQPAYQLTVSQLNLHAKGVPHAATHHSWLASARHTHCASALAVALCKPYATRRTCDLDEACAHIAVHEAWKHKEQMANADKFKGQRLQ